MRNDDYAEDAAMDERNIELQDADDDLDDDDAFTDTDVLHSSAYAESDDFDADYDDDEFVGESSVIFDVDDLVAEFEAESETKDRNPSSRLRKRLEAIAERKRRHADLLDFADYDI